jgi:outer membrane protein assembly factor BamB
MKRLVIALTALSLLGGCGVFKGGGKHKTPTIGERIPVLSSESGAAVDPTLSDVSVVVPGTAANSEWAQSGGNASKSMGNLTLGTSLSQVWSVSIGAGSSNRARLAAAPVLAGGKIFTIDARAVVRAISPTNGATLWETQVAGDSHNANMLFGGGVSYDNGKVYVTNGIGNAAALDADKGAILWKVRPGGPLRGAPTIANDNVYVVTQDNQVFALNPADGSVRWQASGSVERAGVFGSAAPAAAQGTVVVGFSSGELNAYRYENGQAVWQDALTRTSISTAVSTLSDVDADPVIDQGRVYAVGQGGRMVAIELNTGQRVWELNIAGISTPWVAGEWVFVVTDDAQLFAISRSSGKVRWMTQLAGYRKEKAKKDPIRWLGPVLAGDRLLLANSAGQLVSVSPQDGSIQSTQETKIPIAFGPVVVANTLYLLGDDGRLSAWR